MKILKILVFKKFKTKSIKYTCIFLVCNLTIAQSSYLNLDVENDLYFLTDEYYSSGIFIERGKVIEKDSIKKFKIWELGQEIYTPSDTDSKDFQNYDYPFGGWTFLKYILQIEKKNNGFFEYGFQFGLTGEWSLADRVQNFYHKKIINADIPTWEAQIPKAIHLNIFKKTSITVACSRWEEPFGRTSLEASANGCAVIITNKGGLPETVTDAKILEELNQTHLLHQ